MRSLILIGLCWGLGLAAAGCRDTDPGEPGEVEQQARSLGEGFTAADVGAVGSATGTYSLTGSVHRLEGAGADIWGNADAFRFVYETLPGNGTITARVATLEKTNAIAKAGVMMRESTAAGAKNVMALLTPTASNGYRFQSRTSTGGITDRTFSGSVVAPGWVRLTRTGSSFAAFSSPNGTTWTAIGPAVTISMSSTILVGLAVTSHAPGVLATATFDNLSITTPAPPAPPSAPQGLTATAGNAQVSLTWSASSGATSYALKSSTTAGGPYAPVQTVTGTSYVNTQLVNGTTYYYRVSAIGAAGEGANSAEASATPVLPPPPPPPQAPPGLIATAGNAQVTLNWSAVAGATSYTVKSRTSTEAPHTNVQTVTGTSFSHTPLTNGTTYFYVVTASNVSGESASSSEVQATPMLPPPPTFASQDIGSVGATGSWTEAAGTHTLRGAGADIFGAADAFRFAHQSITGDVTVTARVQSLQNTNTWAKAVVMIRENLNANSRNVATVVSPTAGNKYRLQVRSTAGGTTSSASSAGNSVLPSWIRLQRTGSTFRAFHSLDGEIWTQLGPTTTLALPATVRVGIGVTGHAGSTLATAVFTNVTIGTPQPPPPPPDAGADSGSDAGTDAGVPDASGSAPDIQADASELIFSAFRNTRSVVRTLVVRNAGATQLAVQRPTIQGPSASIFLFDGTAPNAFNLAPGAQTTLRLVFSPATSSALGPHQATLRLTSDDPDRPILDVGLYGLATAGDGGENEPPMSWVVNTLGYAINVGGTSLSLGIGPAPIGDEVLAHRFVKAGPGPITMRPIARYSPNERLPYGIYTPGTPPALQPLGAISLGQHQTLLPTVDTGTVFQTDPGAAAFGLYTSSSNHTVYTEDARNSGTVKHAVRSYPLKDRAGNPIPNTFLVGFEEAANGDYQDFVFVLGNVAPAP